ncbi:hypothetical protein [Fluviispira multicolorata]|uniref:Uncharacterized protein n=1 Tax=Fluviispira multicolorata TaxID=2654512 RepID=A0A833N5J8_9BACT|nr:hypothetical protein [Fluviispira multicolorata]KAB8030832.1 hypothetical protein GCL57_07610 [Fluviispira multicolorata]
MQPKLLDKNFIASLGFENIKVLRQVYEWIQIHTELCHLYSLEESFEKKLLLKEKVDESFERGRTLFEGMLPQVVETRKRPSIPLSGVNRFAAPATEVLKSSKSDNVVNKSVSYPFHAEYGTKGNVKRIPMPSRTYIKKK